VVEDTPANMAGQVHYLPHHAVIRKDKQTTKLRIVYDASACSEGVSLSDNLFSGPRIFWILLSLFGFVFLE